jgi:hypothetical protein
MYELICGYYNRMKIFTPVLFAGLIAASSITFAQQASSPGAATPSKEQPSTSASSNSSGKSKKKPVPSFLIVGTVFDEHVLSFPGVEVRVRRAGEKKFRWDTYTNSRGEFAVRVPPGPAYEVAIHVKNYADQTRSVDSKNDVQQRLSIQLEPLSQAKTGAKP